MAPMKAGNCPSGAKLAFASSREANRVLMKTWREGRRKKLPTRSYRCQCGKWHLTSQPRRTRKVTA